MLSSGKIITRLRRNRRAHNRTRVARSAERVTLRAWQRKSLWLICLLVLTGCNGAPDLETSRQFQKAEDQYAQASEPEDYVRVAAVYQEILDAGFRSGVVYYNQGNAWMQAGRRGRAIAAYRQAQRFLPRDPYLDANLKQALAGRSTLNRKPLLDYVFFWQRSVSYQEKGTATTILLGIVLMSSLAAQLGWHPLMLRRLSYVTATITLLSGISLARDWISIEQTRHGVVVIAETTARKGAAESFEPVFNQPLVEGTEFITLDENPEWLNVRIGDLGEGWIPKRDGVTY